MTAKKLDLGKAIEREHSEPQLTKDGESRPSEEAINLSLSSNAATFEMRLKIKSAEEQEKFIGEKIKLGMTPEEVMRVAGNPDSIIEWYSGNLKYKYGNLWVVIEDEVVTCLVQSKHFEKYWGRSDYKKRNPSAIYK